jgi:uncharacterized membrane protein
VVLTLIFGSIFIGITPVGHIPDVWAHVYRVSSILNGDSLARPVASKSLLQQSETENVGGAVDSQWIEFSLQHYDNYDPAVVIPDSLQVRKDSSVIDVPFNNTATNTPVAYLPQIAAFGIGKLFNTSSLVTYYLAEYLMLVFYALCMGLAVYSLPRFRLLISLLLVSPLMLFRYSFAISADSMTQAFVILYSCLIFSYLKKRPTMKQCLGLAVVSIVLSSLKFIYVPLALLMMCLILVHRKPQLETTSKFLLIGGGVISIGFVAFWMNVVSWFTTTPSIVSYQEMLAKKNSLINPATWVDVLKNMGYAILTGQSNLGSRSQTLILRTFLVAAVALIVLLLIVSVKHLLPGNESVFWWAGVCVVFCIIGLTYLALWLQYTPEGVRGIDGMQFRYLVPFVVLGTLVGAECVAALIMKRTSQTSAAEMVGA